MNGDAAINPERMSRVEGFVDRLFQHNAELTARTAVAESEISTLKDMIEGLRDDQRETRNEVKSLRHAIITMALSFAGGSLALAFTIAQVFGG